MKTIAFFNNKGGVGKTSLVYHIAWMLSLLGENVLVADLDPQANATSIFISEEKIEKIWLEGKATVYDCMKPLIVGIGDISVPPAIKISDNLSLLPGHLSLSEVEDQLSETWPKCLSKDERAFRVTTAFSRIIAQSAQSVGAEIALIDVGPNLGAINRAALVAADFVVIPLSADLFAIRGLENVGPKLRDWRCDWQDRLDRKPANLDIAMPSGGMKPLGYVVSRYSVFARGPVKAYKKWLDRAPHTYRSSVLREADDPNATINNDKNNLATLKDYRSLMPMAQESRKPMFLLKPADGAIGGHQSAVQECRSDFQGLAQRVLSAIDESSLADDSFGVSDVSVDGLH